MGLHGVLGTIALLGAYFYGLEGLFGASFLGFFILAVYLILTFKENGQFFDRLGKQLFALWYLPLFLPFFVLLRSRPQGIYWIFFLMAVNSPGIRSKKTASFLTVWENSFSPSGICLSSCPSLYSCEAGPKAYDFFSNGGELFRGYGRLLHRPEPGAGINWPRPSVQKKPGKGPWADWPPMA